MIALGCGSRLTLAHYQKGLNEENIAALGGCKAEGGKIDCTGGSVDTMLTTDPGTVANWVSGADFVYSFVFLVFIFTLRWKTENIIHQKSNLACRPINP